MKLVFLKVNKNIAVTKNLLHTAGAVRAAKGIIHYNGADDLLC